MFLRLQLDKGAFEKLPRGLYLLGVGFFHDETCVWVVKLMEYRNSLLFNEAPSFRI